MFRVLLTSTFTFLCLILCADGPHNSAQIREAVRTQDGIAPFARLTLEIFAPSLSVLRLQPLPIVLRQSNRTNQLVQGYSTIGFGKSPVSVAVRRSGDEPWKWVDTSAMLKRSKFTNVPIQPGATVESQEWLSLGLDKYFPETGTYEMKAVLANDNRTQFIESNILSILVVEPTGIDRLAYNLVRNSGTQDYLFSGLEFSKAKITLSSIATRYPNSAYTKSAFFVLGEAHFHRREYPEALLNLMRLEHDDTFIHAERVRRYLAEIRGVPTP